MQSRLLIWHVLFSIVADDDAMLLLLLAYGYVATRTIILKHIIEVLIFIYLSFVRLLLYNKHLIDV